MRHERVDANPCQGVERFALDNERVRYLTENEEQRLFRALGDNTQLKDIVTVALHTGMRRGEIFNLTWFDLDFDRGVMHLRKTKTKLNRVVPMNARVREVLKRQKRSSEFVFTSEKTGGRLIDVKKAFSSARLEAGIPDFQLRDLRHSCATRLSDKGEELVTVAEILGHTDIRMTKRYELIDNLLKDYKKPEDIIGENGLLKQLTKQLLERAMAAELTEHVGYEKHDTAGHKSGNSRNGKSAKTLKGSFGTMPIEIPRDRNGTFEPQIIEKHQTRFTGFDANIISLYARGLSTREIQQHLEEIYHVEVSPALDLERDG